jgi:hypothetical protein
MPNNSNSTTPSTPVYTVTGKHLAHCKSERDRIAIAHGLVNGRIAFAAPTVTQAARLARVSPTRLYNGRRKKTLADHLTAATPDERTEAARVLGVDDIWQQMVLPLVG